MTDKKQCSKCKVFQPLNYFKNECKQCKLCLEAKQWYRENNHNKLREYARQYYYSKNEQTLVCPVCECIINKYLSSQTTRGTHHPSKQSKRKRTAENYKKWRGWWNWHYGNISPKPKTSTNNKTQQPKQSATSLNYSNDSESYDP